MLGGSGKNSPGLTQKAVDKAVDTAASMAGKAVKAADSGLERVLGRMTELENAGLEPSEETLKYGLGAPPEASRIRQAHAISALTHGARRQGERGGLGRGNLPFAYGVLHCGFTGG